MTAARQSERRLLILTGVFPMEIQPFVTAHVRAMLDRGWTVGLCARKLDRTALEKVDWAGRLSMCVDLSERSAGLAQARNWRIRWHLWRRFGRGVAARLPADRSKKLAAQASALLRIAQDFAPAAIHAHFGSTALVAAPVAWRLRLPLLASFHGEEMNHWGANPHGRLYDGRLDDATIVVHSRFMQQWVSDKCGHGTALVPFGVDLNHFSPRAVPRTWNSPLRLGVIGRLSGAKGQHVALNALRLMLDAGLHAHLTLAGDGEARQELQALAAVLQLSGHTSFAGLLPHPEVAGLLAGLDALLIPSVVTPDGAQETFSLVALEALSRGVPVIASRIGGLPEAVGEGGILVPPEDPQALASAVQRMVLESTPERLHQLALSQAKRFSLAAMADGYEAALNAAVQSGWRERDVAVL